MPPTFVDETVGNTVFFSFLYVFQIKLLLNFYLLKIWLTFKFICYIELLKILSFINF